MSKNDTARSQCFVASYEYSSLILVLCNRDPSLLYGVTGSDGMSKQKSLANRAALLSAGSLVDQVHPMCAAQRSSLFPSIPSFALLKASDTYSTPCVYHHYIARTLHTLSASLSSARSAPFVASVPTCYLPMLPVAGVPLQLFAVLQKTTQALP